MGYERVVRTRVPVADQVWTFGSGYLVAPGRVLTARHVLVVDGKPARIGQTCEIRPWPCDPPDGPWTSGTVAWLHPTRTPR